VIHFTAVSKFEAGCFMTLSRHCKALSQNPVCSSFADFYLCNIADGVSQFSQLPLGESHFDSKAVGELQKQSQPWGLYINTALQMAAAIL
jgi:hypothetical protein